jgi:hypothetical protein
MADDDLVRGVVPENMVPVVATQKKVPREGVQVLKVRTRGVQSFRRCGIMFSPDAVNVDATSLTPEQRIELLNTKELQVEEVGGKEVKAEPKAEVKETKESRR